MEIKKIVPDPDLHYEIAEEDTTDLIEKAPQRPTTARHAPEQGSVVSEDTNVESKPLRSNLDETDKRHKLTTEEGVSDADIERLIAPTGE